MRRSTLVAIAGAGVAVAGGVWYQLTRRGTAREIRVSELSAALGVVGLGVVMIVGGLVATAVGRRRDRKHEAERALTAWPGGWPTIVVRDHRRRRPQIRSVPPSA
jgi:hypothetical protein